jgi:hypothetical protein
MSYTQKGRNLLFDTYQYLGILAMKIARIMFDEGIVIEWLCLGDNFEYNLSCAECRKTVFGDSNCRMDKINLETMMKIYRDKHAL